MTSLASTLFLESLYILTAHSYYLLISSATSGLQDQIFTEDASIVDTNSEIYSITNSKHSTNRLFYSIVLNLSLDKKLEEQNLTNTYNINSKGLKSYHKSNIDLTLTRYMI
jgi:hypothetical protein